ncbi:MAG: ribonuclease E inhibitor RraB [Solirubrobacteraceae bacterium]
MEASPDRFERLLQAHLEVNPKSWAALQARGVGDTTPVQLDFEFTADDEAATRSLMRFLGANTDYDYKGGARNEDDGSQRWMVLGETSPMTLTLDGLNDWVARMTAYGRDHGPAVFDGWGARLPEPQKLARKRTFAEAVARRRGRGQS